MNINSKAPGNWKLFPFVEIAKFIDYRGKTPKKTTEGVQLITALLHESIVDIQPLIKIKNN
jgi:type I restriction enzyme, S subunit